MGWFKQVTFIMQSLVWQGAELRQSCEWWGTAVNTDEDSLTTPMLTSCCAAWSLTGSGVEDHGHKGSNKTVQGSLWACRLNEQKGSDGVRPELGRAHFRPGPNIQYHPGVSRSSNFEFPGTASSAAFSTCDDNEKTQKRKGRMLAQGARVVKTDQKWT